jgi:hypothetical protein
MMQIPAIVRLRLLIAFALSTFLQAQSPKYIRVGNAADAHTKPELQ